MPTRSCLLVAAILMLSGCIAVPLPSGEFGAVDGNEVVDLELSKLQLGTSTKTEVISILGQPTIDINEYTAFVYAWLMNEHNLVVVTYGMGGLINVYNSENRLLAFNKDDQLVAKGKVDWPVFGSIRDTTHSWLVESGSDLKPSGG